MKTSCIQHPTENRFSMLRTDYWAICETTELSQTGRACAAKILNVFEQWTNSRIQNTVQVKRHNQAMAHEGLDIDVSEESNLWVYESAEDLQESLIFEHPVKTIRQALIWLVSQNLLMRRKNPKLRWDKTYQYQLNTLIVQEKINQSVNPTEPTRCSPQATSSSPQATSILPTGDSNTIDSSFLDSEKDSHTRQDPSVPNVTTPSVPNVTTPTQESVCEEVSTRNQEPIDSGSEAEILKEVPREEVEQEPNEVNLDPEVKTNQSGDKTNPIAEESREKRSPQPPLQPDAPIAPEYSSVQRYENSMKKPLSLEDAPWRVALGNNGFNKEIMAALTRNLGSSFSHHWDVASTIGWVIAREKEDHPQHCVLVAKVEVVVQEMEERKQRDRFIQENNVVIQQPTDIRSTEPIATDPTQWASIVGIARSSADQAKRDQAAAKNSA